MIKDFLGSMQKIIKQNRYRIAFIFIIVLISFLISPPYQRVDLFVNGDLNPQNKPMSFSNIQPAFKSLFSLVGLPFEIDYYNLHIYNTNKEYDISYSFTFDKHDPLVPFLKTRIPISTLGATDDHSDNFTIMPGQSYVIKAVPIKYTATNRFGMFSSCGFESKIQKKCPDFSSSIIGGFDIYNDNMQIYATPYLWAWFSQLILTTALWVVVINSLFEFLGIEHKK